MLFMIKIWGARGRKFESCHPDLRKSISTESVTDAFFFFVSIKAIPWFKRWFKQNVCHTTTRICIVTVPSMSLSETGHWSKVIRLPSISLTMWILSTAMSNTARTILTHCKRQFARSTTS